MGVYGIELFFSSGISVILILMSGIAVSSTGGPNLLHERGRDFAYERRCVTKGYLQSYVFKQNKIDDLALFWCSTANSPKTLQNGLRRGQTTKNTTRQ